MNAFVLKIVKEIPVAGEFDLGSSFIDGAIIHCVDFSHWKLQFIVLQIQWSHKPKGFFSFKGGTILFWQPNTLRVSNRNKWCIFSQPLKCFQLKNISRERRKLPMQRCMH